MTRDVVVVHPGVQHSGQLAADLHAAGRLRFLATRLQIGDDAGPFWGALETKFPRRRARGLPDSSIRRMGAAGEVLFRGVGRIFGKRAASVVDRWNARLFNARFLRSLPADVKVVVATDTAAQAIFEALADARPDVVRVLDVSHPLDVAVQPMIAEDALRFGLAVEAYDDYHPGPPKAQIDEIMSAHAVLVASRFSASTLTAAGVDPNRIKIVPYGLRELDRAAMTATRIDPGHGLRLLALGAMSERKGMTLLLRAMEELEQRGADVSLVVAGRPAGAYRLPQQLPNNVTYLGSPDSSAISELYLQTDVLVLPSMCEGFGRTILEALAAGCSVITTERSGGPDVVRLAASAPITIVRTGERDRLADVLAAHLAVRDEILRPADARRAALVMSAERYVANMSEAIDAARAHATAERP